MLDQANNRTYLDAGSTTIKHLQTINLPSVIQALNSVSLTLNPLNLDGMALALSQLRTLLLFPDQDIDALIASVRATKDVHWAVLHFKFLRQALVLNDISLARQWVKNLNNY